MRQNTKIIDISSTIHPKSIFEYANKTSPDDLQDSIFTFLL